jgi:hypothetical protein
MPLFFLYFWRLFPFSKLDVIEQRLRFFSENPSSSLLTDRMQGDNVFQPLEDLREAMLDYQVHSQPQTQFSFQH